MMYIIDIVKVSDFIDSCPFIGVFSTIFTAYNAETSGNVGVYDDGETLISKDMTGNQHKRHKYALVARNASMKDIDRITAVNFCQNFQSWIDDQERLENYPEMPENHQAFSISAQNARLSGRSQDGKTATFEIPFEITYWRFV